MIQENNRQKAAQQRAVEAAQEELAALRRQQTEAMQEVAQVRMILPYAHAEGCLSWAATWMLHGNEEPA